jgi:hypothetical protein
MTAQEKHGKDNNHLDKRHEQQGQPNNSEGAEFVFFCCYLC